MTQTHTDKRSLKAYVAVSNHRYKILTHRLNRLERIVMISSGSLFAGMLSVILTLLQKL